MTVQTVAPPGLGELAGADAAAERALAALPPPAERTPAQRAAADAAHRVRRAARRRFLREHAVRVHDELSAGAGDPPRLRELAERAAERFPGLCPSPVQLAADAARPLAAKEGHEIDVGLFLAALLAEPGPGGRLLAAMRRPTTRAVGLLDRFRAGNRIALGKVVLERRGRTAHLTLANGRRLNAEDTELVDDLETAVDLALLDDRVGVGVLRGGPAEHPKYAGRRVFCAGVDLTALSAGQLSLVDFFIRRELGPLAKIWAGLSLDGEPGGPPDPDAATRHQKPWVTAVDTFAIGGGMQLALVADRVVAADDAYFSLPAAAEGIVPGAACLRLGRYLGARDARRILLGGDRIGARDPRAGALCDAVAPPDALDEAVSVAAAGLDTPAVRANRHMLHLVEEPADAFRRYMAEFAAMQGYRLHSPDLISNLGRTWKRH